MSEQHQIEIERANEIGSPLQLKPVAFRAAWHAFQETRIDLLADSDDETCRCVANAVKAYLANASTHE